MKSSTSIISIIFALLCLSVATTSAFVVRPSSIASSITSSAVSRTSNTSLNVFGKKKSKAQKAEEAEKAAMYWEGEWVCKDCGYIYNRAECADLFFEEQTPGFRCPQCSGPRRRYAKKVGDRVGTTLDGGDAPILIFSFGGVALTIAFGIWAVENL
ncbi:hypothetical protein FRACYDRAFT_234296 [Fragilariopsis cylindrus CCMP1102]|uniref:Rubredoxin-like domain-containing protein n=1 Tax=Fragilariopsis cylindrus CCMP1102 TaxID=635003 RepID=A0A1E7FRC9_9STRA|nr:hypothetical protein FRACYDRAFT_234296 [Fragilariopsis cylindrus CCMP1102]|eukprot:OEU20665.1 hypothetical protein FRACYDRAFT_234296 [Fragilariopsis cylindrus CCMP1102]